MTLTAFAGGPILTMENPSATAGAVVVDGDRIVDVGPAGVLERYPHARVVDLAGRTLVPGFIDAHAHLCLAALHPRWADCSPARDVESMQTLLLAQAAAEPDVAWVRGVGWSDLENGFVPTRSYHQCVVSSAGLDALGISASTPDPPGGTIGRDAKGAPNGLLVERAFSAAHERSIAPYRDPDQWADHVVAAGRALLADGITCVHDAACPPSAEVMYADLARTGRLPVSIVTMPHAEGLLRPLDESRLDGPVTGEGDHRLRVGAIKLFADGGVLPAIQGHTHGFEVDIGIVFDNLADEVARVVERGFRVAVHAIGNRGVQAAVGAFEDAARAHGDDDHRFRIEHASLLGRREVERMAAIGAVGVVQPGFVHHMGGAVDAFTLDEAVWMPFAELANSGVPIAASSDSPCAFSAPLLTSARGTTRLTSKGTVIGPAESLPYETWMYAYTAGAAFAGGQEHERGRLAPGLRADLVVLEGPLDAERPPRVAETWVDGTPVFQSSDRHKEQS